jgi:hypothetical protein
MTNDEMRQKLDEAIQLITEVRDEIPNGTPTPPEPAVVFTPEELDEELAGTADTILISNDLVYPKILKITRSVELRAQEIAFAGRASPNDILPKFTAGMLVSADNTLFAGLHFSDVVSDDIVFCQTGIKNTAFSQCCIMGDPVRGNKRGIYMNTSGYIDRCYIDNIKKVGQDTQAVFVSGMAEPGLLISDCYLSGAGQSFMAGGEDQNPDLKPRSIRIINCDLVKNPNYYDTDPVTGKLWQRKCSLELKNVAGFDMSNCHLEGAGIAEGQGGYLIVLTPRNQSGKDPTASVENALIEDCTGAIAGGCVTMLGTDSEHPSGMLQNIVIKKFAFSMIDPKGITGGHGRCFFFRNGPRNITIEGIVVSGANLKSIGYFDGSTPPTGLVLDDWRYPDKTPYTWHNIYGDTLASLQKYVPDAQLTNLRPL